MREIAAELKALRLYGMASAWSELTGIGGQVRIESALWLIEHLLDAEGADRVMRSIRYQMTAARFPIHRDLASFDFGPSCVDRRLIGELADLGFTDDAHNVVLIGGPGTGKTHLATALGVSGITRHERRVRFFSTVDRPIAEECGSGDPRRAGLSALQPGRRRLAVPSALEAL